MVVAIAVGANLRNRIEDAEECEEILKQYQLSTRVHVTFRASSHKIQLVRCVGLRHQWREMSQPTPQPWTGVTGMLDNAVTVVDKPETQGTAHALRYATHPQPRLSMEVPVVIITGVTSGIGLELVRQYHAAGGVRLVLVVRAVPLQLPPVLAFHTSVS